MPARGRETMLVHLPVPDDYVHFARCGFFAYDWHDVHRTLLLSRKYEMMSRPDNPIHLDEMPHQFHELLSATRFGSLHFADSRKIDVREYFDCEPAV